MNWIVTLGLATLALWAGAVAAPGASAEADGESLYDLCQQCHGPEGEGNAVALAPNIAGLPEWYVERQLRNYAAGLRGTHPDDLAGLRMYPMSRSLRGDEEFEALARYVSSLPRVDVEPTLEGGDPERGASYYAVCQACHGPQGDGNQALNAPPIFHQADWYMQTTLQKYKAGIRGQDAIGSVMVGMANTLPNEQAILDVIAYIKTLDGSPQ